MAIMAQHNNSDSSHPLRSLALPVYAPAALFSTAAGMVSAVLVLTALSIGFSDSGSSALAGFLGLLAILLSPLAGNLIVRIGDRRALLYGGALAIFSLLFMFAAATQADGTHRFFFVVAIFIFGISSTIWMLARQAYVAESVPLAWRARALSTLGGMNRIGALIGPMVTTALITVWWIGSIYAAAVILLVFACILVLRFLVPTQVQARQNVKRALRHEKAAASSEKTGGEHYASGEAKKKPARVPSARATLIMGITMNGTALLRASFPIIIPLWGTHLNASETLITSTFAATAFLDTIMFLVVGGLMDRYGRHAAILPSLTIMPLGIVIMICWPSTVGFVVGASILGFGNGFGAGTVMTVGADLSPRAAKASFLGIWQSIVNVGGALGPFLISGVTHIWGITAALWTVAILGLACAGWMILTIGSAYRLLGLNLRGEPLQK